MYLEDGNLNVITFGRGLTWLYAETHELFDETTSFVTKMIVEHQGLMVSYPEKNCL